MTVVPEATVARGFGLRDAGVTSMHDATEGGVLGGLTEVASASGVGMRIDLAAIPVPPAVRAVCDHVGIDPYISISEGTLLATVVPSRADAYVTALADAGMGNDYWCSGPDQAAAALKEPNVREFDVTRLLEPSLIPCLL